MKLYYSPGACSLASHIVIKELGLPAELVRYQRDNPPAGYEKIRALGGVPALVTDDEKVYTEGAAILQYLADRKPGSGLAPAPTSPERYDLQETLNFLSTEIHKNFGPMFGIGRMTDDTNIQSTVKQFFTANLGKRFDVLEKRLAKSDYLVGNRYSVADTYLFVMLRWSDRVGISMDKWPALKTFMARVNERPATQAAIKEEN